MGSAKEISVAAPIAAVLSELDIVFTLEEQKAALKAFFFFPRWWMMLFCFSPDRLRKELLCAAPSHPSGADVSRCGVVSLAWLGLR